MRPSRSLPAALLLFLAPPTMVRAQNLGTRLDSAMRAAEQRGFSGVVRVEKDGAVLLKKGYGLANRAERIPFSPATVVQIGSNTKDFTAVAILRLRREGRLSLTDSLGKYFPSAPSDKRNITVAQLMDHRAGFPLGLGGDFEPVGRQALIDSAMHYQLLFAPGTRESYSNTGYSLLAASHRADHGQDVRRIHTGDHSGTARVEAHGISPSGIQVERAGARLSRGWDGQGDHAREAARCRRTILEPSRQRRDALDRG
jgi:CubicO group peptidase (beta-lactamase class C family)